MSRGSAVSRVCEGNRDWWMVNGQVSGEYYNAGSGGTITRMCPFPAARKYINLEGNREKPIETIRVYAAAPRGAAPAKQIKAAHRTRPPACEPRALWPGRASTWPPPRWPGTHSPQQTFGTRVPSYWRRPDDKEWSDSGGENASGRGDTHLLCRPQRLTEPPLHRVAHHRRQAPRVLRPLFPQEAPRQCVRPHKRSGNSQKCVRTRASAAELGGTATRCSVCLLASWSSTT